MYSGRKNADIDGMKKIIVFVVAFCIAALCIPQYVAAQAYPAPGGDTYRQEGIASWYGTEFDGRPTASGEVFNSSLFTAAHPTLPFGTYLLITNRHNNRQVAVRINDRGPFVPSRIIDVSRAAAEQLDMLVTGTAPVVIETFQTFQTNQNQQVQPQPVYQPPAQPNQPVYPQAPAQPPVQQPQVIVVPAPSETPSQAPSTPITVTIYPPAQAGPPQPVPTQLPSPQLSPLVPPPQAAPLQAPEMFIAETIPVIEAAPPEVLPALVTPGARLIPTITPSPGKRYSLQVGSYKVARNAVDSYVKLREAGLNPEYERHGEYFRVVVKGVGGNEVQSVAEKLEMAGFREAVIREE